MCSKYRMITLHIQNKKGLHARAASAFVKEADKYRAEIWVEKDGQRVSGHSIMGLMMLAASKGTTIHVKTSGKQAKEAMDALKQLLDNKFGEE